jgi:hypothetical protein
LRPLVQYCCTVAARDLNCTRVYLHRVALDLCNFCKQQVSCRHRRVSARAWGRLPHDIGHSYTYGCCWVCPAQRAAYFTAWKRAAKTTPLLHVHANTALCGRLSSHEDNFMYEVPSCMGCAMRTCHVHGVLEARHAAMHAMDCSSVRALLIMLLAELYRRLCRKQYHSYCSSA